MSKLILPFCKPQISHSPVISGLFATLGTKQDASAWFLSNFINIHINTETGEDQFYSRRDFFINCPWIHMCTVNMDQIHSVCSSVNKFIIENLKLGYYLYIVVKTSYIKAYNKSGFEPGYSHNLLVYGFDDDEKLFYIADHFEHGVYSASTCSFTEMENSLAAFEEDNPHYFNTICAFRLKDVAYQFEMEPVKRRLQYHLMSTNLFDEHLKFIPDEKFDGGENNIYGYNTYSYRKDNYIFGIKVYDYLISELEQHKELSPRPFCLLQDHKTLMSERVIFLNTLHKIRNFNEIINQSDMLKSESNTIRNLFIKTRFLTGEYNNEAINRVIAKLRYIKRAEKEFLETLIASLQI